MTSGYALHQFVVLAAHGAFDALVCQQAVECFLSRVAVGIAEDLGEFFSGELIWQLQEALHKPIGASAIVGSLDQLVIIVLTVDVIKPMQLRAVLDVEHQVAQGAVGIVNLVSAGLFALVPVSHIDVWRIQLGFGTDQSVVALYRLSLIRYSSPHWAFRCSSESPSVQSVSSIFRVIVGINDTCYLFSPANILIFLFSVQQNRMKNNVQSPFTYHPRQIVQCQALSSADGDVLVMVLPRCEDEELAAGAGLHALASGLGQVGEAVLLQDDEGEAFVEGSAHDLFLTLGDAGGDEDGTRACLSQPCRLLSGYLVVGKAAGTLHL